MDRVKCGQEQKAPPRKKMILNGQKMKPRSSVFGFQLTQLSVTKSKLHKKNKLEKARNLLSGWEYWQLTLIGKIQVIKSVAVKYMK